MHIKNTDWKKLYELLNDLIVTEDSESLLSELESNIDTLIPADRGLPMFEIRNKLPICIRWPEYSSEMISLFNSHFNRICPVNFEIYANGLTPVAWNLYRDTEYDCDFNRPLDIGFSMGGSLYNQTDGRLRIIVINRSRKSAAFTPEDLRIFNSLTKSFSVLYNQRELRTDELKKQIYELERHHAAELLSEREIEICRQLCSRKKAAEIAEYLGISRRTVERHEEHIYFKLGVRNRKELFRQLKV